MTDSIGQTLREAREQRGLSVQEARQALRIHASYLEALEAEDFAKLPAPVYVRAFLRQYARLLDLDPEALVEEYMARCAPAESGRVDVGWTAVPQSEGRSLARTVWMAGVGLAVAAVVGTLALGYQYQAGKEQAKRPSPPPAKRAAHVVATTTPAATVQPAGTPAPAAVTGATAGAAAGIVTPNTGTPPPSNAGATPGTPAAQPAAATAPVTPEAQSNPAAAAQPAAAPGQGVEAVLTAKERTWLAVRADGAVVFQGTLQAGESRTWKAGRVLKLRTGNAGGLAVSINGKDQGPLGATGTVVERVFQAPAAPATTASAR